VLDRPVVVQEHDDGLAGIYGRGFGVHPILKYSSPNIYYYDGEFLI
jgi:hypothetical protein